MGDDNSNSKCPDRRPRYTYSDGSDSEPVWYPQNSGTDGQRPWYLDRTHYPYADPYGRTPEEARKAQKGRDEFDQDEFDRQVQEFKDLLIGGPKKKPKEQQKQPPQQHKEAPVAPTNNESTVLTAVKHDAKEAARRTAANQLLKTVKTPLIKALSAKFGNEAMVAAFLETPIGEAVLGMTLAVALGLVPVEGAKTSAVHALAEEVRIQSATKVTDLLADVLLDPLRNVLSSYLLTVMDEQPKDGTSA